MRNHPAIGSVTMQDWIGPLVAAVLALVAVVLGVALQRARSRTARALAEARSETAALRVQVDALEERVVRADPPRPAPPTEFVITRLGDDVPAPDQAEPGLAPEPVGAALFADLVLRETVVKAASLAHGVRRVLDPETRNRIRFEMRRELKRARKQRRVDTREARREWEARQRSRIREEGSAA